MEHHFCNDCGGASHRFEGETFFVEHGGSRSEVPNLSGWRCDQCQEVDFDAESTRVYAAAGDRLVLMARARRAEELRAQRQRLGLTQEVAAMIAGGGHNAFSRYERGEAEPVAAVYNLFRILDNHPALLAEIGVSSETGKAAGDMRHRMVSVHA